MLFDYIKASALQEGDLIATYYNGNNYLSLIIVHELHEDELGGEPCVSVDGIVFIPDEKSKGDTGQPVQSATTNAKFVIRDYPSVLLLRRAADENG